jgi:flavin reductase (DIM6/NTAB) family NADH-FMN oxidoreductase RutF
MKSINLSELSIPEAHKLLLGSVGPRPICFASTVDKDGNRNLSPFSFFNVFSANPPIVVFSPARSGRTGKTKDTFENCKETREVVINVVNYDIVEQMSLSSSPYEKGVDEFIKAGLTPVPSEVVKPFRVKESPVQMEAKVNDIVELGQGGGAGNLIICEVVRMHIKEDILDEKGLIDQHKINLVSRMGGNWYCHANEAAMFEIPKPLTSIGVGVDKLPDRIRNHKKLSGNHLGRLGQLEKIPSKDEYGQLEEMTEDKAIRKAIEILENGQTKEALMLLMKNIHE